jgi:hypothetical protein
MLKIKIRYMFNPCLASYLIFRDNCMDFWFKLIYEMIQYF